MSLILQYHPFPCSHFLVPSTYPKFPSPNPQSFIPSKPRKSFSLSSARNLCVSSSSAPIFLPFLQEEENEEKSGTQGAQNSEQSHHEEKRRKEKQREEEDLADPFLRFFKSRISTEDPSKESKLTLNKSRRSSWHLARDDEFAKESEYGTEDGLQLNSEEVNSSVNETGNLAKVGVVGEVMKIAKSLPENLTIGEALEENNNIGAISEKECVEILELMGEEEMAKDCLYFFEWMRVQEPSLVTPRACSVLFPILGRAGMGGKLMIMFKNLPPARGFRDIHVYNAALSGLSSSRCYDDARKIYEEMEANNIQPDHVTASIMITTMRRSGCSAKEAWDFFERMNRKGVQWRVEVLGALMKSFCDEGLTEEALIIQSEMEKKGVCSNATVYNTLMDAYTKSDRLEEAEGLFQEMKEKGIMPTPATYNILMNAYSRRMQPKIVEKLLEEMKDVGLESNAKSYTCLISAYGRKRNMSDMAADAFLKMKKIGIKPTSHSFTALIHAYSVSGWHEKAYKAFENMTREGIKPSVETYTALLDAFRRAGDAEMLTKIWKMMIGDKIRGTRVTFNILLDGFCKHGHYIEARNVIFEFGEIGLGPTVMTYNMLMNACARGGRHSKLPELLKEMTSLNLKPDSVTYSTVIYAYIRVRDFKRAFFYHKQMVRSGQVPDAYSYHKLRKILDVKAGRKNRADRSAMLGLINSKLGLSKAKKWRKKDQFWKDRKPKRVHRIRLEP